MKIYKIHKIYVFDYSETFNVGFSDKLLGNSELTYTILLRHAFIDAIEYNTYMCMRFYRL